MNSKENQCKSFHAEFTEFSHVFPDVFQHLRGDPCGSSRAGQQDCEHFHATTKHRPRGATAKVFTPLRKFSRHERFHATAKVFTISRPLAHSTSGPMAPKRGQEGPSGGHHTTALPKRTVAHLITHLPHPLESCGPTTKKHPFATY